MGWQADVGLVVRLAARRIFCELLVLGLGTRFLHLPLPLGRHEVDATEDRGRHGRAAAEHVDQAFGELVVGRIDLVDHDHREMHPVHLSGSVGALLGEALAGFP